MSTPAPAPPTITMLERMEPMIKLTERLTELIAQQAAAFEAGRPQDAAANMEETTRLANLYRHEAKRMRDHRSELLGAPAALRQRLMRATEAFDAVMSRQERALKAAKTITEGLVHAIAQEVVNQRSIGLGYGPGGAKVTGPAGTSAAITLNRRA